MIEEFEARRHILEAVPPGPAETVRLPDSLGCFLRADAVATVDLPGFDNSSMDGYAIRAADQDAFETMRLTQVQAAGLDEGHCVGEGEAVRIYTGAPLPDGADAVVMQEDVELIEGRGDDSPQIRIVDRVAPGENIRRRGSDVCEGQKIAGAGALVTPGLIGLLASQGLHEVAVGQPPSVGVVTTGDELIEPGLPLSPGQIYNSNAAMLCALVRQSTGAEALAYHAPDDPDALRDTLREALVHCEFLLIAGGVSVGERDFVKEELARLGVRSKFWRVRVKPGKPFLFGQREEDRWIFGLPGNPVSAFITFQLFVRPALLQRQGAAGLLEDPSALPLPRTAGEIERRIDNTGDRPHYVRGRIDPVTGVFRATGLQRSDAVFGLSQANALLRMAPGEVLEPGTMVRPYLLG